MRNASRLLLVGTMLAVTVGLFAAFSLGGADAASIRGGCSGCLPTKNQPTVVCKTGSPVDSCSDNKPYCSSFTCRDDCTQVNDDLATGMTQTGFGGFTANTCQAAGSTYNVINCTNGWGSHCNCDGAYYTGPWPCPRAYMKFISCQ